jgi:hypothetical protein
MSAGNEGKKIDPVLQNEIYRLECEGVTRRENARRNRVCRVTVNKYVRSKGFQPRT